MKTIRMVALRDLYYEHDLKRGDEFDAQEAHVQPLSVTGGARVVDAAEPAKVKPYNRRDRRAED